MNQITRCLFSPRLFKVYKEGPINVFYKPNSLEKWGDKVVKSAYSFYNVTFYASPAIILYLLMKKSYSSMDESRNLIFYLGSLGCLVTFSLILRSLGRATNPKYVEFLDALYGSKSNKTAYLNNLRNFEFEFEAWPVTYQMPHSQRKNWFDNPFKKTASPHLPVYKRIPVQILAYLAKHTFGLSLIYPGSMTIVHYLLGSAIQEGRINLVEEYNGQRTKIGTSDGNSIDTMFVDNRKHTSKGKILVICCEGNSGFYEVGIMTTPLKAGYSALGWNHPGFATSTGSPFPSQEQSAVDAVLRLAVDELGFRLEEIVVYGWSIGGYTASWLAAQYPDIKGLVLDATFDDLMPLALNHMPASWEALVREVVVCHVNLNISDLLDQYKGPVSLVRRTDDEIICLRPGQLSSNRANDLLVRLLKARHPQAVQVADQVLLWQILSMQEPQRATLLARRQDEKHAQLLELIQKYMRDVKSTHCQLLPEKDFDAIVTKFV